MNIKLLSEHGYNEIPGFLDYLINEEGNVVRKDGFIPKTRLTQDGYVRLHLFDKKQNKYVDKKIHRLVAITFIGVCPDKYEVNHKDGNKLNNSLENLEYLSHYDNMQHAFKNNLAKPIDTKGERNIKAKLKEEDVLKIREMYSKGNIKQTELAEMFGIEQAQISCIILRKNWRHI